jgi:hypothetical protein
MVSFMSWPLYTWGRALDTSLGGPQNQTGRFKEENNL